MFYSFNFMLMQVSLLQSQELLNLGKCNGMKQSIIEELCKSPHTVNQANR